MPSQFSRRPWAMVFNAFSVNQPGYSSAFSRYTAHARQIATQMPGQHPCLQERQPANRHLLIQKRVRHLFAFALLVSGDHRAQRGVVHLHGPAFSLMNPSGLTCCRLIRASTRRSATSGRNSSINRGPIQAARPIDVQEADTRIESRSTQPRNAIMQQQGIDKRQQSIDRGQRRPPVATFHLERTRAAGSSPKTPRNTPPPRRPRARGSTPCRRHWAAGGSPLPAGPPLAVASSGLPAAPSRTWTAAANCHLCSFPATMARAIPAQHSGRSAQRNCVRRNRVEVVRMWGCHRNSPPHPCT